MSRIATALFVTANKKLFEPKGIYGSIFLCYEEEIENSIFITRLNRERSTRSAAKNEPGR